MTQLVLYSITFLPSYRYHYATSAGTIGFCIDYLHLRAFRTTLTISYPANK